MTEITINLDQYNLLFEKAMSFDKICDAVKANIDKNDLYPVKDDDVLLLTGLTKYQHDHIQAMANSAEAKKITCLTETIEKQNAMIDELKKKIEQLQPEPEAAQPEEEESHAEDQAER